MDEFGSEFSLKGSCLYLRLALIRLLCGTLVGEEWTGELNSLLQVISLHQRLDLSGSQCGGSFHYNFLCCDKLGSKCPRLTVWHLLTSPEVTQPQRQVIKMCSSIRSKLA